MDISLLSEPLQIVADHCPYWPGWNNLPPIHVVSREVLAIALDYYDLPSSSGAFSVWRVDLNGLIYDFKMVLTPESDAGLICHEFAHQVKGSFHK